MRMDHVWRDVRFALRQFFRSPGLTAAAILALACGIGAVTTVFTLVDAVLLRPLPVAAPGELVWLRDPSFSYPLFQQVRDRGHMFSGVFAWEQHTLHAEWAGEAEATEMLLVSGAFYDTLGIKPALGRLLTRADVGDSAPDAQAVAVLSYPAWQQRFGADPTVIGRTLRIETQPFTIVGVAPRGFFGIAVGTSQDVTIPVTMLPRVRSDAQRALSGLRHQWLNIMGRVRPGLSIAQADAAFQTIWPQVLASTTDPGFTPERRKWYLSQQSGLEPGATGESPVRRQFGDPLWLLFGLVGLLLVVACATVANLLLAAAADRQRELALRLAIGAGRARLVQQLFVEGLLLATAGGVMGTLFSAWAADLLVRLLSTTHEPVVVSLALDGRILAFTAGAIGLATMAFTVAPIVRAARIDPGPVLKAGARQGGQSRGPARTAKALVVVQVAVSLVLVAGSALFVRNLTRLLATDVGFDRQNLLVVSVDMQSQVSAREQASGRAPDVLAYDAELLRRLREVPGVRSASLSWVPPISNEMGSWWDPIGVDGAEPANLGGVRTYFNAVSPEYFATIGMRFVAGRDFRWSDRDGAPGVVIVNESLARAYFGNANPIGRQVTTGRGKDRKTLEIVGIVRDSTYQHLQEEAWRVCYVPYMQALEFVSQVNLVGEVRPSGRAVSIAEPLRAAVRAFDPKVPLRIETVTARIDESLVRERLVTVIATFLGAVSLLLACGALGGLMSHVVAGRTNEIGLRMALGAERHAVVGLVVREAMTLAFVGTVVGLALALAGGRLVSGFLYGTEPSDPLALGVAMGLMLLTASVAGYLPARRAARIDPMVALRAE